MRRGSACAGAGVVALSLLLAPIGMAGHMAGHMLLVAVAAPLLALAARGTRFDPAVRWPRLVNPLLMSLVELVAVWGWHLPFMRAHADLPAMFLAEQASFLGAGLLLWSSVLAPGNRVAGIGALLLTAMHMTLLGTLFALAQRPLYLAHDMHGLDMLADQQLGGVAMLVIGGISYTAGALALLAGLLRMRVA
jgi:putative membrane protein